MDSDDVVEAIADAIWANQIALASGADFIWDLLDALAEHAPRMTVAELHAALGIYRDRYAEAMAAMDCLPTVPAPEAMQ